MSPNTPVDPTVPSPAVTYRFHDAAGGTRSVSAQIDGLERWETSYRLIQAPYAPQAWVTGREIAPATPVQARILVEAASLAAAEAEIRAILGDARDAVKLERYDPGGEGSIWFWPLPGDGFSVARQNVAPIQRSHTEWWFMLDLYVNGGVAYPDAPRSGSRVGDWDDEGPVVLINQRIELSSTEYDGFGFSSMMPNGDIVHMGSRGATHGTGRAVHQWRSTDNGNTWTSKVATHSTGDAACGGGVTSAGTFLCFEGTAEGGTTNYYCARSTDNGETFANGPTLPFPSGGLTSLLYHGPLVELPSGKLLQTAYGHDGTRWVVFIVESTDDGLTWTLGASIHDIPSGTGPNETAMVFSSGTTDANSVLFAFSRTDPVGALWVASSVDGGATWTKRPDASVRAARGLNVAPWVTKKIDGTILLTWGDRRKQTISYATITEADLLADVDGWSSITDIYWSVCDNFNDFSYPSVVRVGDTDNSLLAVFYDDDLNTDEPNLHQAALYQNLTETVILQDTFTDPDNTRLNAHTPNLDPSGLGWTEHQGEWSIVSNRARRTVAVNAADRSTIDSGVTDFIATGTVELTTTVTAIAAGFMARDDGANNYFQVLVGATNMAIWEITSGSGTQRKNVAAVFAKDIVYPFELRVQPRGLHLTVGDYTMVWHGTSKNTATRVGIMIGAGSAQLNALFDDFTVKVE